MQAHILAHLLAHTSHHTTTASKRAKILLTHEVHVNIPKFALEIH